MSTDSPSRPRVSLARLTGLLLFVGLAARLTRYLLDFPIWGDEAFVAVNFLLNDFSDMWRPLIYHQIAPLGYMWATLAVTKVAGVSEYALRSVALFSGIVALFLFWRFTLATVPRRAALLALGFLAAAYYVIRHGAEVKPYATDLLVSLALLMLAWRVRTRPSSVVAWLALIVFAAAAVWLSYPAIFVIGSVGLLLTLTLAQRRSPEIAAGWLAFALVVGASAVAMVIWYAEPHASAVPEIKDIPMWRWVFPLRQGWMLPAWLVVVHAGLMMAYPIGAELGGSSLTLLLVIIGSVTLWKSGRRDLLLLLLGPLLFNFIAAALEKYPYGGTARTMLYMAPSFCLLAGLGLYVAIRRWPWSKFWRGVGLSPRQWRNERNVEIRGAVLILALIGVGSIVNDLRSPYKTSTDKNIRDAVRGFATEWRPGDTVIVYMSLDSDRTPATLRPDYAMAAGAPPAAEFRGDGGSTLLFQVARAISGPPLFAPLPAEAPRAGGRVWAIALRGPEYETFFDRDAERAYFAALAERFGPPAQRETIILSTKREEAANGEKVSVVTRELVIERFD